ncbi:YIP1 family protein [uncultured Ferrimonas sp.]|uniref:YIP1 family protein n=1 Tax=uncultured Ferrimonas sp. TaxID=432640 RepID=UPI00260EC5B7|nr:YIP1 family protein [uncultured Ferrimonas sp.]
MNSSAPSIGTAFINGLVAPSALFGEIKLLRRYGLYALMAVLLLSLFSNYTFFSNMSEQHLLSEQLAQVQGLSASEMEMAAEMMQKTLPYTGLIAGAISAASLLLQILLLSVYVMMVAKLTAANSQLRFSDYVNFSSWCYLPACASALGLTLLVFTSSTPDLPLSLQYYASFNQLFIHYSSDAPLHNLAQSFALFDLWIIALLITGFITSFKLSFGQAIVAGLLPYALIYGTWFAIA